MSAIAIPAATAFPQLDKAIERVKASSRAFATLSIDDRIALLKDLQRNYYALAEEMVAAGCKAKGLDPTAAISAEEWLSGPVITLRIMHVTLDALLDVKRYGAPRIERSATRTLPDGRLAVRVFPNDALESTLLAKQTAEVYMQPGITFENLREHQASFYRKPHDGRVCAVLGAGNVGAIAPTDCIYKMFVEGKTCVLKMNPVNAYLGPFLERAFQSAIDKGFFAVVYGGAEEGAHLVNHPAIDEVHITGSDKTHDLMVWGPPGPEREARKQRNEPLLKKEITSELGNISPVIIVPGPYSDAELDFQARNIAGMIANNSSFNCNAAKLLIMPTGWDLRTRLLERVEAALLQAGPREPYYPGAAERWKQLTQGRSNVKTIGEATGTRLPFAILTLDPNQADERFFHEEPWCAVTSEMSLGPLDVPGFLAEATRFVHERLWGTLNATLIVHPATEREPSAHEAIEKTIRELRYGTVAVNTWPAAGFGLGQPPWGGHPSSTPQNIQSGRGFVHNSFMLEGIEKCVLRAPVKLFPPHPWFPGHRAGHVLARRLAAFEYEPSWLKVPGLALAALRA